MYRKWLGSLILMVAVLGFGFGTSWGCPSVEAAKELLQGVFRNPNIQIVKVAPAPVSGLCEVVVSQGNRKGITYMDNQGRFLIAGRIIDLRAKKDLTSAKIAELNRIKLSAKQLEDLKKHVAFSAGSGPELFLITDPDCPFCKRAEKALWELVQENKIKVNVVFYPLEKLHPKAKAKAISMICEKKGFKELMEGYNGNSTCPEGEKKVEGSIKFVQSLGVRGTPTYVFPSGETHSGVLSKEKVLEMAGHGTKASR